MVFQTGRLEEELPPSSDKGPSAGSEAVPVETDPSRRSRHDHEVRIKAKKAGSDLDNFLLEASNESRFLNPRNCNKLVEEVLFWLG